LAFVGERGVYGLLHCHRRELVRWYFSILVLRLLKDMRIAEEVELIY
jgi:prenyltransferase beta subunit